MAENVYNSTQFSTEMYFFWTSEDKILIEVDAELPFSSD